MTDASLFDVPVAEPPSSKRCPACEQTLPIEEFYRQRNHRPGRRKGEWTYGYRCKPCTRAYQRSLAAKHRLVEKDIPSAKWCGRCRRVRASDEFARNKSRFDGLQETCLDCHRDRRYGLATGEYDQLLAAQDGGCAICGSAKTHGRTLAVDHCHETGRVRGLLCTNCNSGLGMFQDSPSLLSAATSYLRQVHRT